MNLCFSNIAWGKDENKKIINLFNQEKRLSRICSRFDYKLLKKRNISKIKKFGKKRIKLYSMQSVLTELIMLLFLEIFINKIFFTMK